MKKLDAMKKQSTNTLDPFYKKGKMSNVYGINISFPPCKSEKLAIDKINRVDTLVPDGYAVPALLPGECCGNEYIN